MTVIHLWPLFAADRFLFRNTGKYDLDGNIWLLRSKNRSILGIVTESASRAQSISIENSFAFFACDYTGITSAISNDSTNCSSMRPSGARGAWGTRRPLLAPFRLWGYPVRKRIEPRKPEEWVGGIAYQFPY